MQGENGDRATEEAAEKLENLSLSCDPAADSQVYSFTWYPLDGVQRILSFLLRQIIWIIWMVYFLGNDNCQDGFKKALVNLSMAGLFKSQKRSFALLQLGLNQ